MLKLAYLIVSYKISITAGHKIESITFLSFSLVPTHSYSAKVILFYHRTYVCCKEYTCPTSLPCGALLSITFLSFGLDCLREPSEFSSKHFDKPIFVRVSATSTQTQSSEHIHMLYSTPHLPCLLTIHVVKRYQYYKYLWSQTAKRFNAPILVLLFIIGRNHVPNWS